MADKGDLTHTLIVLCFGFTLVLITMWGVEHRKAHERICAAVQCEEPTSCAAPPTKGGPMDDWQPDPTREPHDVCCAGGCGTVLESASGEVGAAFRRKVEDVLHQEILHGEGPQPVPVFTLYCNACADERGIP